MSNNVIDFFATVGKANNGPLTCSTFPVQLEEDGPMLSAHEVWDEAITDLILLGTGDFLPDEESWVFLQESVGGEPLDQPVIAYRKRKFSGRTDHISQIVLLGPGEVIPTGFELIRTTVSGASAYLKPWGYLAIRRAAEIDVKSNITDSATIHKLLYGEQLILEIDVVKKSLKEEIPERFRPIEREGNISNAALNITLNPYTTTSEIVYVMKTFQPVGLCNLAFQPSLLDRYPLKDYSSIQLPAGALPAFVFPQGLKLTLSKLHEYPLPIFYTFVFTDADGQHLYTACLQFYERLLDLSDIPMHLSPMLASSNTNSNRPDTAGTAAADGEGEEDGEDPTTVQGEAGTADEVAKVKQRSVSSSTSSAISFTLSEDMALFVPKVICVLSRRHLCSISSTFLSCDATLFTSIIFYFFIFFSRPVRVLYLRYCRSNPDPCRRWTTLPSGP